MVSAIKPHHKEDIQNFTLPRLEKIAVSLNEPSYRAKQVFSWLYKRGAGNFQEMKNLPGAFISALENLYDIRGLSLDQKIKSADNTEKFLWRLKDGAFTETVLIPSSSRNTICVSTQVGCKFRCAFCASGIKGFIRNLTTGEIINQIFYPRHILRRETNNYVFMGIGEPLDNYDNLEDALSIMRSPEGFNIGAGRITVSTCGIIPAIKKLGNSDFPVNLSISLHAAENTLRNELVPANKKYPLEKLLPACREYTEKTGRKLTLEYILIKDKNDSPRDADALGKLAKKLKAKINLIPCNNIPSLDLEEPAADDMGAFADSLKGGKINVTLRKSRGKDIRAACGQLAGGRQ